MLVRDRYRIDPTPSQRQALARAFGCARVVDHDALAERRRAYRAGEQLGDTDRQRRVVTLAKQTRSGRGWPRSPPWCWCRPARTPGVPTAAGSTRARAAARAAGSGSRGSGASTAVSRSGSPATASPCTGPGCMWPRWASLRVRWSRALPSVPSSVTVIGEPDGRLSASFVVEREPAPLAPVARAAGIDLGLAWLAAVAASDGTVEQVANPRHLRAAQRQLARAQRQLARKRKGSANRATARHRVATAHRKVRDRRADHHYKLALRLVRENQAVAVEDLVVAGLARTRLAKSVHDAGWATLVRLLEEKAAQHGRRVVTIGRWEPTSQVCSVCRHRDGPKPPSVRAWVCPACGVVQDRDVNAARNILVAAGLAETPTACGGSVSPGQPPGSCR